MNKLNLHRKYKKFNLKELIHPKFNGVRRMREEAKLWWKQALKDFEAAEKNLKIREYYLVAFLAQQSVEKALKSLYIHRLSKFPGTTHSLLYLGRSVGIPKELESILRRLTPDFVITRYPDISQEAPYELYDEGSAKDRINSAKKVLEWVKKELE